MSVAVYYFSGTGDSLAAAQRISSRRSHNRSAPLAFLSVFIPIQSMFLRSIPFSRPPHFHPPLTPSSPSS
jgi:hypothetical protein